MARKRREITRAPEPLRRESGDGSSRALLVGALALAGLRVLCAGAPGMWLWGVGLLRFTGPFAWMAGASPFILLIPNIQAWLGRALGAAGDRVARSPGFAAVVAGVLTATVVLLFPDRSHFVGDFLLRFGRLAKGEWIPELFPQVLPLDPWFHFHLPTALAPALHQDPTTVDRWASVLKAGLVGASGVALAWGLGLRGVPAIACGSVAVFSGSLAIFCGYSKGFVELTLFSGAFAAFGAGALSRGRGLAAATLTMALALATHRAAVLLVPAWLLLLAWSVRSEPERKPIGRVELVGSVVAGLAAMVWSFPRILTVISGTVDRRHFLPGGGSLVESIRLTLAPLRLLDVGNVLLLLSPALPLLMVGLRRDARVPRWTRSIQWLGLFALANGALVFLIHPTQGFFRDWDVASAAGIAISCWVAAIIGTWLARLERPQGAGVATVAMVVSSTLVWMSLNASLERTVTRVAAYVSEPPPKPAEPLGLAYRYLGLVYEDSDRPDAAEAMFTRAAELVPSESNLV